MSKKRKTIIITLSSILGVIIILVSTFFIYASIYYHADEERITKYLENKDVSITEIHNSTLEIKGRETNIGVIFYPGGKVEYKAYIPLLSSLADNGYTSLLLKMPFNLAVFDVNAADGYKEDYPNITHWYLMGHSLGGVVVSQYLANHINEYDGIIFLGSYPDKDLSTSSSKMLSIYGENDEVLNKDKYNDSRSKWPSNNKEYVISGGCHAYFGMYGAQKGDGVPSITNEEQIDTASNMIIDFIKGQLR